MGLIRFTQRLFSSQSQEGPDKQDPDPASERTSFEPVPEPPVPEPVPEEELDSSARRREETAQANTSRTSPSATRPRGAAARNSGPLESRSKPAKVKYVIEWHWACCNCGRASAMSVDRTLACTECGVFRCAYCTLEQVKTKVGP
ncbi:hypothetical protein ONS95_013593 [Cadophora gregata]|uniref:uncharacterized protein n=1 Tax=Cadophora gregata TaxID=51156 RepID=UPI0026DCC66C|nr:uncharacterized protein ONS95_013593 [Cadophora gregata]KAK0113337.1 hypothetical protein ONS96_014202 [Cadophora gregata f. sp. sojae]KAK0114088.1 hypothetical protein ONS95_013593 [Cadophora gregata]